MDWLTQSMPSTLEIASLVFTVASIYFAVKRNIWTYPVGILGTILYGLFYMGISNPSALSTPMVILQVVFTIDQAYGWWFWLYGDKGKEPRIRRIGGLALTMGAGTLACFSVAGYGALNFAPWLHMGIVDTQVLGLSLLAQFMLDRKWIENWWVWLVVNPLTVFLSIEQHAYATAILYALLTLNVAWGLLAWRREYDSYSPGDRWYDENRKAVDSSNEYVEKNGLPLAKYRTFGW